MRSNYERLLARIDDLKAENARLRAERDAAREALSDLLDALKNRPDDPRDSAEWLDLAINYEKARAKARDYE